MFDAVFHFPHCSHLKIDMATHTFHALAFLGTQPYLLSFHHTYLKPTWRALLWSCPLPIHRSLCIFPATIGSLHIVHAKIPNAHRLRRRLNILPFPNVLDQTLPLFPINGRDADSYDHIDSDVVIFLDAECAGSESNANHLRQELLNEQHCFLENRHIPGIVTKDDSFYFFLEKDVQNSDCSDEALIDLEAFCISKIEHNFWACELQTEAGDFTANAELFSRSTFGLVLVNPEVTGIAGMVSRHSRTHNLNAKVIRWLHKFIFDLEKVRQMLKYDSTGPPASVWRSHVED